MSCVVVPPGGVSAVRVERGGVDVSHPKSAGSHPQGHHPTHQVRVCKSSRFSCVYTSVDLRASRFEIFVGSRYLSSECINQYGGCLFYVCVSQSSEKPDKWSFSLCLTVPNHAPFDQTPVGTPAVVILKEKTLIVVGHRFSLRIAL